MKNFKNHFGSAGQSTSEIKPSKKHDANLQKNSSLYFQIGLILCLLGTYALFEMQFEDKRIVIETNNDPVEKISIDQPLIFIAEVIKPKEPELIKSTVLKDDFIVKDDDVVVVETKITTPDAPEPTDTEPVEISQIIEPIEVIDDVHVNAVQFVPIYPGCEKFELNSERKKCLNDKVGKLIRKKFNTDIASNYGLSGIQKINVEFKVDKTGVVTDIRARALHPKLEEEAKRIVNKIPQMQPGKMGTKPVNVVYTLPIKFQVAN